MRLTDKLTLLADARFAAVMERRRREGRDHVDAAKCRCVVAALVNRSDQDGCCHPSLELIAAESDVARRTVQAIVAVLVDEGILRVQKRNHESGATKSASTNRYRLDWDALKECGEGGARSRAVAAPDPGPITRSGCARSGAVAAPDQAQQRAGSGAATAPIRRSSVQSLLLQEPPIEPPMNPPQPPTGERGGGEERAGQQADHATLREQAQAIVDAYPPTSSDLPAADRQAALDAILAEANQPERCSWQEIRDAAATLCAAKPKDPRWARNWLKLRGYLPLVLEARRRHQTPCEDQGESRYERAERELRERRERIAATDAALAALTAEELQAEHAALLAETTAPMVRQWLGQGDWRSNRFVREQLAARLARKGLVTA